MSKTLTNNQKEALNKQAFSFIYAMMSEDFINKYAPAKARQILLTKRNAQIQRIRIIINGSDKELMQQAADVINAKYEQVYGMNAYKVLGQLASGQTVLGLNWQQGVYGIGATPLKSWKNADPTITCDTKTGEIYQNGANITDKDRVIYSNGEINGYVTEVDGITYTTAKMSDGNFTAYTYSRSGEDGVPVLYSAKDGKTTTADKAEFWNNTYDWADALSKFVEWLFKLLGINKEEDTVYSSQFNSNQKKDGWVSTATTTTAGVSGSTLAIVAGAALVGTVVYNSMKGTKKGKKKKV